MQHGGGRRPPRGAATPRIPLNIGWLYASLYCGFALLYISARGAAAPEEASIKRKRAGAIPWGGSRCLRSRF